jgi:hypothetical protein
MENQSTFWKTAFVISLLTAVPDIQAQSKAEVSARVLAYFQRIGRDYRLEDYLRLTRPKPVSSEEKDIKIRQLPPNGKVMLSSKNQAKLDALAPILEFHNRGGIIDLIVVSDKETIFIGNYERCAVIITQKALGLLSMEELQAVVAHELAHELYWDEYHQASEGRPDDKVREIELRCDGIAIFTLARLGLNPGQLISAVHKMANPDDAVERLSFVRGMIDRVKQADLDILASNSIQP